MNAAGVGVPDAPRRVAVFSAGNDSALTVTIVGTARPEQGGVSQTESFAGGNGATVVSTQDYATIESISFSGATASTAYAGTNGTASGPWVPWDNYGPPFQISIAGYVMSGAPTYQVDETYDDVFGTWLPANVPFPRPIAIPALTGLNANTALVLNDVPRATRATLTAVGGIQVSQLQQGRL